MKTAYTFNDVMFEPQFSTIESRSEVDLTTKLGNLTLPLPVVSANMADITEEKMARAMHWNGGLGILHRFMSIEENVEMFDTSVDLIGQATNLSSVKPLCDFEDIPKYVGVSVGVGEKAKERFIALLDRDWETFLHFLQLT